MKIVGLIPARGGSKGIKKKNIVPLAGHPLIAHSLRTLQRVVDEVWVSTDNSKISKVSKKYKARILKRPRRYATDKASTELVIQHFIRNVECDVIILVQPTSPMLRTVDVQRGLDTFLLGDYDSVFSVVDATDILLWNHKRKPVNYNPRKRGMRQTRQNPMCIETGGFYIFKTSMFHRTFCRIGGRIGMSPVPFWSSFQVDSMTDLNNIEKLMVGNGT